MPIDTKRTLTMVAVSATALLGACASGGRAEMMAVTAGSVPAVSAAEPGYRSVRVAAVAGGAQTNPMWMSNVSAEDFRSALESSLRTANFLADTADAARYTVTANLLNLERPSMGFDMTTTSSVNYKVTTADNATVYEDTIQARGTAKMGEALLGVERLRKANEASIRNNISTFVEAFRTRVRQQPATAAR